MSARINVALFRCCLNGFDVAKDSKPVGFELKEGFELVERRCVVMDSN